MAMAAGPPRVGERHRTKRSRVKHRAMHNGQATISRQRSGTVRERCAPAFAMVAIVALVTASCGTSAPRSGGSFLSYSKDSVIFLQFTISANALSGTGQYAYLPSGGTQVQTGNGVINGTVSGSSVTINDRGQTLGIGATVSGRFDGPNLVLSVAQQNGHLSALPFDPATIQRYDSILSSLQSLARRAAATQAAAAAAAAAADARAVCGGSCPSGLPVPPHGYVPIATFAPGSPAAAVTFAGRPLEVCFAASGNYVGMLTYEIGAPIDGPTPLLVEYGNAVSPSFDGCHADPGNDIGPTSVLVSTAPVAGVGGSGSWVVQIDQSS